ncbi:MAG TPA: ADOP family duplicated permease [Thermoanaerobaculia bacterium]|nr:ADOP family duplicated permease [Thermoanaerobaculia bacterium]
MRELPRELRFAARSLGRAPGFTVAVLAVLALAIGANVAVLTIVYRVLLSPLDFPGSERVVILCETHERLGDYCVASPPNARDWQALNHTLERVGVARQWPVVTRTAGGAGSGRRAAVATPGWFEVLGLRVAVGRPIEEGDLAPGDDRVAVLSPELARELYGEPEAALGRSLEIDGAPFQVIGVMAERPQSPLVGDPELWLPLTAIQDDVENRSWRGFSVVGRLAGRVPVAEVGRDLAAIAERLVEIHPESNRGWGTRAELLRSFVAGSARDRLRILVIASVLVMLIGCANVANLMLARAQGRQRELGVRLSLGASPRQVARVVLAEGGLLALAGGVGGLALGWAGISAALRFAPPGVPRLDEVAIDGGTVALALVLSLVALAAFGLAPAITGSRAALASLTRAPHARRAGRGRDALVVAELALALMLLAGAGLLLRGLGALLEWDPGFPTQGLATAFLFSSTGDFPTGEGVVRHHLAAAQEVAAVPGVRSVGLTSAGPLFGGEETSELVVAGAADPATGAGRTAPRVRFYDVDPGYLPTLGVPILRGRHLAASDDAAGEPVVVVNAALAQRWLGDGEAVGRRLVLFDREWTVVGVVADVPPLDPTRPVDAEVFVPKTQFPRWGTTLVARVDGDPASLERSVRDRLAAFDPDLQVGAWSSLRDRRDRALATPAFSAGLVGVFAFAALLLAAVGAYGVLSYSVATRTREIGIRLALGARPGAVTGAVVRRGLGLAVAGLAVGVLGAVLLGRAFESVLYGVPPTDPATLSAVVALFVGVALLACWLPARRAGRLDPTRALRSE